MLLKKTLLLCLISPTFSFCMESPSQPKEKNMDESNNPLDKIFDSCLNSGNVEGAARVSLVQKKITQEQYNIFLSNTWRDKYLNPALRDGWIHHWKGFGEGWGKGIGEVASEVGKILFVPAAQGLADSLYGTPLEQQIQLRTARSQLVAQKIPFINKIKKECEEKINFYQKELNQTDLDEETRALYIKTKNTYKQKLDEIMQKLDKNREQELETIDFSLALLENNTRKGLVGFVSSWWNKPKAPVNDQGDIPAS